jgi:hypothetical protein
MILTFVAGMIFLLLLEILGAFAWLWWEARPWLK